jgi:TonB-linked SusC/RagA family outer membrane protein
MGLALAQTHTVQGIVLSGEDDEPIIGASVSVKGKNLGTATNHDGRFVLANIPTAEKTLIVAYLGFETQEVAIAPDMRIVLKPSTTALDEVMVVAYGTTTKSTFTGSASLVKAEQINKIGSSQFLESLQGMTAGVNITNNEGNPGGTSRIQIRGIANLRGATTPLYVVDGVPYDGAINSIAQSDIESLTVLKDAAAASLYGSRAANGVVVITTKKGKAGKPVVSFKSAWGTADSATPNPTKADPYQHMLYSWKAHYNDQVYNHNQTSQAAGDYASAHVLDGEIMPRVNSAGQTVYVTPFKSIASDQYVLHDGNGNPYTNPNLEMVWDESDYDWYGAVFSRKLRQDYSIDVSGASSNNKTNYYVSFSHLNDKGYQISQYFKRYSFRTNIQSEITDWFTMGGNLAYTYSRQNNSGSNRMVVFSNTINSPWLRNADNTDWIYSQKTGSRIKDYGENNAYWFGIHALDGMGGQGDYWNNPDDYNFNSYEDAMVTALYFAEFKLPFGLKLRSNINYDDIMKNRYGYSSAIHGEGQLAPYGVTVKTNGGSASRENYKNTAITWNNLLTWDKSFGDHSLNILLGHEWYYKSMGYTGTSGGGIMMMNQYETASTTRDWSSNSNIDRYALLSFLGRAEYNYQDKYYLSGSVRRDGSSRFHPDNRWGNFGSVGASWRLSKESFLQNAGWLNNLALRASYGTSGNDDIGTWYAYQQYYSNKGQSYQGISYDLFGLPGYKPYTNEAKDLKWEANQQWNIGLDFAALGWLSGTVEYYTRNSNGLLATKDLPLSANAGAPSINVNLGDIRNSGIELTLSAQVVRQNDFRWTIDANFTTVNNKIIDLPGGDYIFDVSRSKMIRAEGHSLFEHYLPKNAGVDPATGKLMYYIKEYDAGGNWTGNWKTTINYSDVTLEDYQFCGSAIPKGFGSVTNSFAYKNFDFSFMWYGSYGAKLYSYQYMENTTVRTGVSVVPDLVEGKYWEKPGDIAQLPRPSREAYNSNGANQNTDLYLLSNDFLRLRNVTLGFTVPKNVLAKCKISGLRLYATIDNLLTFSEASSKYTDPETGLYGNDYNGNGDNDSGIQGPRRVFMGGIQLSF